MSFHITPFKIEPNYKRREESSFVRSSKKVKPSPSTFQANSENSSYAQYLNSLANKPLSNDYRRFLKNRAVNEFLDGDLEGAVKTCNELLVGDPDSFFARKLRGELYYRQHRYEEAIDDLKRAFQAHPFEFEADPKFVIDACLKQKDIKTALRMLNYYLQRHPHDIPLLFLRAQLCLQQGVYGLIRKDLANIQKKFDKLSDAEKITYYWIDGEFDLKMGKLKEAKYCFESILDLDPIHLGALEKCLSIVFKKGRTAKINTYLEKIEQHYPHLSVWQDFAAARSRYKKGLGRPKNPQLLVEAEQHCVQGLSKDPKNECLLFLHGCVLYNLDRYDEAKLSFLNILKDCPNDSHTLSFLGHIDFKQFNYDSALRYFDQSLKIDGSKKGTREARARIYLLQKKSQLAYDDLMFLINKGSEDAFIFLDCGLALGQLGKLELALDYLFFAIQRLPKDKKIQSHLLNVSNNLINHYSQNLKQALKSLYCIAMVDLKNKNFSAALQRLNFILHLHPTYFPARYAKGSCLFKMNRHDPEAMNCFSSTLKDHIAGSRSFLSPKEEKIMLTALEKKGVILRPFQFDDSARFVRFYDNLYSTDPFFSEYNLEKLNKMADIREKSNDTHNHEIVSLQVPHSAKVKGCAYFTFTNFPEKKLCDIKVIHTADKYQKQGFGSLLLNYAIHRAIKRGCDSISLESTTEGLPLYFSYGFKPNNWEPDKLQEWEKWDMQEKLKFFPNRDIIVLTLDLKDPSLLSTLEQKLQKTLSQPFTSQKMDQ